MRIGVTLPTFLDDGDAALEGARRAEELGLDGVFVFDHLWPMGRPDRPAMSAFPMLGAIMGVTTRVSIGPLVARIGLLPDDDLVEQFMSLHYMGPGRVIAGLGTGDSKSAEENRAFGLAYGSVAERRESLERCARELHDHGVAVWIGGGAPATNAIARRLGVTVNLWEASDEAVRAAAGQGPVTWGGPLPGDIDALKSRLGHLAAAGAAWVVCAWPPSLEAVAEVAASLR